MEFSHFPWPRLGLEGPVPRWTGQEFVCGESRSHVLSYHQSSSHWSEDLTRMHEEVAGAGHPIDIAGRALAVGTMKSLGADRPLDLLDVGCSSGFVLEDLRKALPRANLIGADYIRGPLEGLARRMPDLPLLQFDLRQCPLPDACVDGITCLNVLEHIDDDRAAMGHLARILKVGGRAHIEVPAGPQLYDIYDEHLMHHRRYRLRELVELAAAAGFRVLRATHLGFMLYPGFVWVKRRNRRFLQASAQEKERMVSAQIRGSMQSPLVARAIKAELLLGRFMRFPVGIRCVAVLQKP